MIKTLVAVVITLLVAIGAVYTTERASTHARVASNPFVWFVAVKRNSEEAETVFAPGPGSIKWRAHADSVLVGEAPPYWDEFYLLGAHDANSRPRLQVSPADAYIVRIEPVQLPLLLSGALRWLHRLGLQRISEAAVGNEIASAGFDAGLGPSPENVAKLKSRPVDQQPVMVNFLRYFDAARYSEPVGDAASSGREAYARYGSIAFRTVYSLGGQLVTSGKIVEVVREPQAGPTLGEWSDIAIMQYPTQQAILSMEQVPEYRRALAHRNASLERTRIVASLVF